MSATFKEDDDENTEENAYISDQKGEQAFYFSATRPRSSTPVASNNSETQDHKLSTSQNPGCKKVNSKKISTEPCDVYVEEIQQYEPHPNDFDPERLK
mmetsp:Transcript_12446/g.12479  ORF Transcript_12446/g.12479 Transcript_12446/m.12479 type:complete len:98 (+) Transcript_12446:372-665(+)|eukprot:CAMPEP_0197002502 /NCGR_PEP_ID=MMETSP1380-20130617/6985_1 /TAXON_ID=5936 /ORGANISM="Euplotes crassus, Strain CT5" /LENGTH=97 /DNA_ID=CAMNT_0042420653 /DNA_START=1443 /DNA_END=1736 /DNA_ORIENTATION=+